MCPFEDFCTPASGKAQHLWAGWQSVRTYSLIAGKILQNIGIV
jgi:hypothetical protein